MCRYTEVANNVQMQETILTIQFVLLDSSPLKFAILAHCQEWQNKFTGLLYEIATSRLSEVNNYLNSMKNKYVTDVHLVNEFMIFCWSLRYVSSKIIIFCLCPSVRLCLSVCRCS